MSFENSGGIENKNTQAPTESLQAEGKEVSDVVIDIFEFAERDEGVPHAREYRVRIDDEKVTVDTPYPTGALLLSKVGKRPCAFELIEEFVNHENCVVEPD